MENNPRSSVIAPLPVPSITTFTLYKAVPSVSFTVPDRLAFCATDHPTHKKVQKNKLKSFAFFIKLVLSYQTNLK